MDRLVDIFGTARLLFSHRLQIWRRVQKSEASRWQPLLRENRLLILCTRASSLHFVEAFFFKDILKEYLYVQRVLLYNLLSILGKHFKFQGHYAHTILFTKSLCKRLYMSVTANETFQNFFRTSR